MTIKGFETHLFSMSREEKEMLNICVEHLDPRNLKSEDTYDEYNEHLNNYKPYVQPQVIKNKLFDCNNYGQIIFIKPEIEWLCRGLEELALLALENPDDKNQIRNADIQLRILDEFCSVVQYKRQQELYDRFEELS